MWVLTIFSLDDGSVLYQKPAERRENLYLSALHWAQHTYPDLLWPSSLPDLLTSEIGPLQELYHSVFRWNLADLVVSIIRAGES